jgi:hypothetical protein
MVGNPEMVEKTVSKLWDTGMKLVVVSYSESPAEQQVVYDKVQAICR